MRFVLLLPFIFLALALMFLGFGVTGKAQYADPPVIKSSFSPEIAVGSQFTSKATAFFPSLPDDHPKIRRQQGGSNDRFSQPLHTLQDFLEGKASYVSVAMDPELFTRFPYNKEQGGGWRLRIPELEQAYNNGKPITFRLVDTGDAFKNKGFSRIDICVRRGIPEPVRTQDQDQIKQLYKFAYEAPVNGTVTLMFEASDKQIQKRNKDINSRADDLGGPAK